MTFPLTSKLPPKVLNFIVISDIDCEWQVLNGVGFGNPRLLV